MLLYTFIFCDRLARVCVHQVHGLEHTALGINTYI